MSHPISQQNPFRDADHKPDWAQLTRLAGDRAAILFEELREWIGAVDGLVEELHYHGPEQGWLPRYRVGNQILFSAHVLPGLLEATLEVRTALRQKVLASRRIAAGIKERVRSVPTDDDHASIRVPLSSRAEVRAFVTLLVMKSQVAPE